MSRHPRSCPPVPEPVPLTRSWLGYPVNGYGESYTFGIEELSSAVVGGKLYVFGGWAGYQLNIGLCYDPATDSWATLPEQQTPVGYTTAVAWRDEVLLLGGYLGDGVPYETSVQAFDTVAGTWRIVTHLPDTTRWFGAAIHKNILYLVGGVVLESLIPTNAVRRFDLKNETWLPDIVGILPRPFGVPYSSACPVVNGRLIMAGGGTSVDGSFPEEGTATIADIVGTDIVLVYDIEGGSIAENTSLPDIFSSHLLQLADDKLFVCGGDKGGHDGPDDEPTKRIYMGVFTE